MPENTRQDEWRKKRLDAGYRRITLLLNKDDRKLFEEIEQVEGKPIDALRAAIEAWHQCNKPGE